MIVLALLTLLHAPRKPQLLLMDDIEKALHPDAIRSLLGCLRRILEREAKLQIIATTHSPYLIDSVDADEVVVLKLDDAGHTRARLLSEHPDFGK